MLPARVQRALLVLAVAIDEMTRNITPMIERLEQLSSVFAIEICAYAVMSNHYHLVLHVDQARSNAWTAQQVIEHWTRIFSRPLLIERWAQGLCGEAEREVAETFIEQWRRRLCDVSWYMRCLNEHLARRANADKSRGRETGDPRSIAPQ